MLAISIVSYYCIVLLIRTKNGIVSELRAKRPAQAEAGAPNPPISSSMSFQEIGFHTFGPRGQRFVEVSIVVLQLSFVRIYKGLSKFAFKSAVKTWCYRIAYNESMRFLETNKKRMRISEDYNAYRLENLYADPYFDANAADASLQKAIAELDNNQREVFCMKYYDELKFAEIAEISNRNENSVKTLFYKAKEIISNQIVLS